MFQRIAEAPGAVSPAQASLLHRNIDDYYDATQDVSKRLIDQETGLLHPTEHVTRVPRPVCIQMMPAPWQ